ncbi:hypothetical protein OXB_2961 [Bacillus sp. OxB-1]|nr:hypothetical protein [Bacillus sp. OxB-1]BAQ11288.1 hypothetical protein OXB_2817 [Bacillus sp. OxB-1]BAQ11431.1 hypothetical protein OXB_2961 [Bacillus sp. OxB-1]
MFNENSGLIAIWVDNVKTGKYTREQVPKLSNLQEVVWAILDAENAA